MIPKVIKSIAITGFLSILILSPIHSIIPQEVEDTLTQVNAAFDKAGLPQGLKSLINKPDLCAQDIIKVIMGVAQLSSLVPGIGAIMARLILMARAYPEITKDSRYSRFAQIRSDFFGSLKDSESLGPNSPQAETMSSKDMEEHNEKVRKKYEKLAREVLTSKFNECDGKTVAEWLRDMAITESATWSRPDDNVPSYLTYRQLIGVADSLGLYTSGARAISDEVEKVFNGEYKTKVKEGMPGSRYNYYSELQVGGFVWNLSVADFKRGLITQHKNESGVLDEEASYIDMCCTNVMASIITYYQYYYPAQYRLQTPDEDKPYFEQIYLNAKKQAAQLAVRIHKYPRLPQKVEQYAQKTMNQSEKIRVRSQWVVFLSGTNTRDSLDAAQTLREILYTPGNEVFPELKKMIIDSYNELTKGKSAPISTLPTPKQVEDLLLTPELQAKVHAARRELSTENVPLKKPEKKLAASSVGTQAGKPANPEPHKEPIITPKEEPQPNKTPEIAGKGGNGKPQGGTANGDKGWSMAQKVGGVALSAAVIAAFVYQVRKLLMNRVTKLSDRELESLCTQLKEFELRRKQLGEELYKTRREDLLGKYNKATKDYIEEEFSRWKQMIHNL